MSYVTCEPIEPVIHRDPTAPSREFPDRMLAVREGSVRPTKFRSSKRESGGGGAEELRLFEEG